jgi:hypothetical protein
MKRTISPLNLFVILVTTCLTTGCEPAAPSKEELGRIVFSESEVPGANDIYIVPERLRDVQAGGNTDQKPLPGE